MPISFFDKYGVYGTSIIHTKKRELSYFSELINTQVPIDPSSSSSENNLQRKDEYWKYIPLVKAALAGNWESAKKFFDQHKCARRVRITKSLDTVLHIAVGTGKALHFVEKLVEAMKLEELELCDDNGFTALHTAASVGNTAAAMVLVKKHPSLLYIRCNWHGLPIHVAAMQGRKETLCYLLQVTEDYPVYMAYHGQSGIWLLLFIMASEFYDSENRSIFHHAIVQRHENVFNLIYQVSEHKRSITICRDNNDNTTLHMAGQLAPRHKLNLVPGASLQMQRELQWFEEVKKFASPYYIPWRNRKYETAEMVFTEAHKELVVEGEKWMKGTANSCTIVAVLIVTIAFAAAISDPGGNNEANDLPILSNETVFLVFAISNAFSLFTSTTSLVMFLSILTSTYAEKDFLFALPKRLIIGLVTLFFSITAMMVAFSSIVYLLFGYNKRWVLFPMVVFSGIPIISFVCLEFPLLLDLITSTYGIFGKNSNRLFC